MSRNLLGRIIHELTDAGPLTGAELWSKLQEPDYFDLWRECFRSGTVQLTSYAHYYLRYDTTRTNFLRLSPSILRDFLTYTLIALPHQRHDIHRRQLTLCDQHRALSFSKLRLAMSVLADADTKVSAEFKENVCAFVAGDIAYFMSHDEPRPSHNSRDNMSGSDIDIIVVYGPGAEAQDLAILDKHLTEKKILLMKDPAFRQELDFIVKPVDKVFLQAVYKTISDKIACKIIFESLFIWGSTELYMRLRHILEHNGVVAKIESDFREAINERADAVDDLLNKSEAELTSDVTSLFYFSQERVEFSRE